MNRNETLRRKRNEYLQKVEKKIESLHRNGYLLVKNPLRRGYKRNGTEILYFGKYRGNPVLYMELASRCPHWYNRNWSNNYHCVLVFERPPKFL